MYSVKPIGLNTKDNDRDVPDGSLLESINMQWRDGAFKPIPERIVSEINVSGYSNIILHKVGDENQINVLGFNSLNALKWLGTITDGAYTAIAPVSISITKTTGLSFTILNGLIYFMGDGSSATEQYYLKLEYKESAGTYVVYDMYAWKTLIPFYPFQEEVALLAPNNNFQLLTLCGLILVRFALVLKSGEVVLHSPIYGYMMYGLNRSDAVFAKGDLIQNIHTVINMDLSFADSNLFDNEISAINFYTTTPFYETKLISEFTDPYSTSYEFQFSDIKGKLQTKAEESFHLVKTIDKPAGNNRILITAGPFDSDIELPIIVPFLETTYSRIDSSTIAAGEIMPVDNFSYHKLFGKIDSYNGRIDIKRPVTVLSGGCARALSVLDVDSQEGFNIVTEDGILSGVSYSVDKSIQHVTTSISTRGLISYPDLRANIVRLNDAVGNDLLNFKCRKNNSHNMSCAFDLKSTGDDGMSIGPYATDLSKLETGTTYNCRFIYETPTDVITPSVIDANTKYSSANRIQFSEAGEFKVWPALNSYRIGEGKVMNLGTGSVNPSESQVISPIIVGTTDGIYTINLDPSGSNFIASITKTKNIPFLSEEILEIDNNILFVSDQGLMVFSDGDIQNLTADYFPQQGDGNYPEQESIFPRYDLLTSDFFGLTGNPYELGDIVEYMRGAIMAYDGRRRNIWCSNPSFNFSLVFNLDMRQWGMSTLVFNEKQELFSTITTDEGDIYTRYMVKKSGNTNLLLLSGEDLGTEVFYHILTRPIKFQNIDDYKVLPRMISRSLLVRDTAAGYLSFGLWGQQEVNKFKKSFPIALKKDNRSSTFYNNTRYHIPVDCRKGKYKTITVLQAGKVLPESYISSFDFDIYLVDDNKSR